GLGAAPAPALGASARFALPARGLSPLTVAAPEDATTSNWSGYLLTDGPYTGVSGSFTVPRAAGGAPGPTVSEWVGVDGWGDDDLIQAGVDEVPEGSRHALYEPWWEVLPGPQVLAPGVMVRPGDKVTVTLRQSAQGTWAITLTDNSDDDSFSANEPYEGPLSSAEWVVEANSSEDGTPTLLAPYQPEVAFSDLGASGAQSGLTSVTMVQSGAPVSTPSALSAKGFDVAYGKMAPPAPVGP
ncbi:MAG: G1 family glutamic endopeptidase, partial [Acidimicrobiales bacterium]